jgi:hypothetical protein
VGISAVSVAAAAFPTATWVATRSGVTVGSLSQATGTRRIDSKRSVRNREPISSGPFSSQLDEGEREAARSPAAEGWRERSPVVMRCYDESDRSRRSVGCNECSGVSMRFPLPIIAATSSESKPPPAHPDAAPHPSDSILQVQRSLEVQCTGPTSPYLEITTPRPQNGCLHRAPFASIMGPGHAGLRDTSIQSCGPSTPDLAPNPRERALMSISLPIQAVTGSFPAARPAQSAGVQTLPGLIIAPAACLAGRLASRRPLPFLPGIPHD